MKTIIAYKQGRIWVLNVNGCIEQLHYSIRSKEDVQMWFAEAQNEHKYEGFKLEFA